MDEWLAYDTIRYVRIKNAYIGAMHYFFLVVITGYLIGYVFLYEKKYLDLDTTSANTRFSVLGPCQPFSPSGLCKAASPGHPIKAVGENCSRFFACDQHSYCIPVGSASNGTSEVGGKGRCIFWDHNAVVYPPSEKNALTIATRASIYKQHLKYPNGTACGPPSGDGAPSDEWNCQYMPSVVSGQSFDAYIADLENFTISMAQDVTAMTLPITRNGAEMKGDLVKCKAGKKCRYDTPSDFDALASFSDGNAVFTVAQLLASIVPTDHKGVDGAGVELDAKSAACPKKCISYSNGQHLNSTNRWMGFTILLDVQYDNTGTLIYESSHSDVRYRLRAYIVPESVFRVEVPYYQSNNAREVHHLHGLRIIVMAKGHLGQLSLNTVLIQLTTSLTLLALSTTLVDIVLLYFMKYKDYYRAIKYQDDTDAIMTIHDKDEREELLAAHEKTATEGGLDYNTLSGGLTSYFANCCDKGRGTTDKSTAGAGTTNMAPAASSTAKGPNV